jgi:isochorismate pyruvate lyase
LITYKPNKQPDECQNISEIRDEIDRVDREILKLLGIRFRYVKQVVKYKEKTKDSIVASKRRETVITQRREWAVDNGLSPDAIEEMYRNLIQYFIDEEMKIIDL